MGNCKSKTYDNCSICLEPLNKTISTTKCKHNFHTQCLEKSMEFIDCCPLCRYPFKNKNSIRQHLTREQLIDFILERLQEEESDGSEE